MSRRASLIAKQERKRPAVRFPDELVFLDNMKGNDIKACSSMLRRASVQIDINGLDTSGLTPLHNAVLEGNLNAVRLLLSHGANVDTRDTDTWTPLHAACANGEADIARYLLSKGASKDIKTEDGERPLDLCDARDFAVISVMLESDKSRRAKLMGEQQQSDDSDLENNNTDDDLDNTDKDDNHNSHSGDELSSNTAKLSLGNNNSSSSSTSSSSSSSSSSYLNRPRKPPGHSILKKSTHTLDTMAE